MFSQKWFIYNIEHGKELHFIGRTTDIQNADFDDLQFCPVKQSISDTISTISSNSRQLQVVILLFFIT